MTSSFLVVRFSNDARFSNDIRVFNGVTMMSANDVSRFLNDVRFQKSFSNDVKISNGA